MNSCKNCGKETKNKYCNVSCQNKHQGSTRADKVYGKIKKFKVSCNYCEKEFYVEERERLFPKKEKYFCSRSCANKRVHNQGTKQKISNSLKKTDITNCLFCKKSFIKKRKKQKLCSKSCSSSWKNIELEVGRKGGLASAKSQRNSRRSKNEIHFANLCEEHFDKILTNESIFNGWDADIIIEDIKYAVLWNGVWHYKKITKLHSVKQVKNRDKIKIKEIIKCEYTPYIIKDMGGEDEEFVKKEFKKFINILRG